MAPEDRHRLIDESLWGAKAILAHPMFNNQAMIILRVNLLKFLEATGHQVTVLPMPRMAKEQPIEL